LSDDMAAKKKQSAKAGKKKASKRPSLGGGSVAKASEKRGSRAVKKKAAAKKPAAKAAPARPTVALPSGKKSAAPKPAPAPVRKKKQPAPRRPATAALRAAQKAPEAPASVEDTASPLQPGDRAPSFELSDQHGASVSSASLAGKPYVLYFYPKDDTPGCTTEACGFRDAHADFESTGVRVLGVSPDSVASHQKFVGKYGLPFSLLSDPSRELASAYGVWALKKNYGREFMGIVRSTFLVDAEGVVRKVWRGVRVNGHVPAVQAAAAELG
jgi:thioredoxin-dependent peroxiredoxin